MAAISSSPPPTASSSPVSHHQHTTISKMRISRKPTASSLPSVKTVPRLRDTAPKSPVRRNVPDETWAKASNVNYEFAQTQSAQLELVDRVHAMDLSSASPAQSQRSSAPKLPPSLPNIEVRTPRTEPSRPSETGNFADFDFTISPTSATGSERLEPLVMNRLRAQDGHRQSGGSDETASTSNQGPSLQSSATTSASSVSTHDNLECVPHGETPDGSVTGDNVPRTNSVPQFQYHHQTGYPPRLPSISNEDARGQSSPNLLDSHVHRHLTPTSHDFRSRPQSSYSNFSEMGPRGRSPGLMPGGSHMRAPSAHSRRSPDVRHSTYAELLNVPYPQQAPAPIAMDNAMLRSAVGTNASLLSTQKTLEMYRQNVKKTNDFSIQYSFAVFLISTAQEQGLDVSDPKGKRAAAQEPLRDLESPVVETTVASPHDLVREARQILQRLANGGYPFAQYYLADGFASGLFNKGKPDASAAFPLFVLAAKHGHAESAYRAALCYEFGWGCRKDPAKAVQYLRIAAAKRHPGAMTRLGKACLSGDLGEKRYREGIKWMKLAAEAADSQYNAAPYQLGCLYETGYGDDVFVDLSYAAELYTQSADLGHPEANYRMGDAYEHGRLNCPKDPALSVHFYTGAAEQGHAVAMMGLCAWYMVGAVPILERDEEEAYEWARRSADLGFVKAQYAVGYFTEMGIGCRRDILEANLWYVRAADAGDERAKQRLSVIQAAVTGGGVPMEVAPPRSGKLKASKDDKDCVVM